MSNLAGKTAILNNATCFAGRGTYRSDHSYKRHFVNASNNIFPPLEENIITRSSDPLVKHVPSSNPTAEAVHLKHEMMYGAHPPMAHPPHMDTLELMEPLCSSTLPALPSDAGQIRTGIYPHPMNIMPTTQPHTTLNSLHHHHSHAYRSSATLNSQTYDRIHPEDTNPRDLEAFAERFKQRRIKLGVTQADVGRALVHLKIPGVGTLSQSTICRFESLTLSRNNMMALRPVLQSWLEAAESQARGKKRDTPFVLPSAEKKRKRTSIAAIEKRSLEAYFAIQQRPSGEKIASIAEKLDLKKSVVRVWFCNQRQKQKRMKYTANQNMN